jgi:hypothetical protein
MTVPESIYLALAKPPEGVDPQLFELWHEEKARLALTEPGVSALRCFRMAPDVGALPPITYPYLTVYKSPASRHAVGGLLQRARDGREDSPAWLPDVRIASFLGRELQGPMDLSQLDHVYLVFTKPPADVSVPDFFDWYVIHMRENLTAEGFVAGWRYGLEADIVDPVDPADPVHAAFYEVHGELPELRASLTRAENDGRVSFPAWFPRMQLACLDCYAISDVLAPAGRGAPTP